ncbi:MAG TPA: hydantoinase/oxoprolinase family protein [Candidatus Binataceae bacterium]|nr:hydantoinase/oxoprolinase family protein [Candidatus Binataceae bacterium]
MTYRLGVDVGGTFTDLLLIDDGTGETFRAKVPTTPGNQAAAVLEGIDRVCASARIKPSALAELMHGTTAATNAVLEGKGARVGLITTEGFRQILQVARSYVPGGLAGWIIWPKPEPLAALDDTVEVRERIGARGEIVRELDEASAREALSRLKRRAVEAITVSLINAYANPVHERRIREIAKDEAPELPISLSSEILPEMREYERTITTVANSYVRPAVARYLSSLRRDLKSRGVGALLKVLRSDGGLMSFEAGEEAPVNMLLSGPAGGVAGARWVAKQAGFDNVLTLDMGGTSTDVCLIEHGEPRVRRETMVGNVAVRVSSLDVRSVGAGGGSIAKVPELTRALRVGPESAGAEPGPAAYARGGVQPTVTDANLVLGYLPADLLGGAMKLDRKAAERAVGGLASALGIGLMEAAAGIIDVVNEHMFGALRLVSVEQGYDPRGFALVAFGGAGPLHANALGALLGCWPVIIPPSPGVLCAYGDATTRLRNEAASTYIRRFSDTSAGDVVEILGRLRESAAAVLDAEGVARAQQSIAYQVDVRYHGQGFEVPVAIDLAALERGGFEVVRKAFDEIHRRLFTFNLEVEHEFVNLRAIVQENRRELKPTQLAEGGTNADAAAAGETPIWAQRRSFIAKLYDRASLLANNVLEGPALVTEMDSTTLILPGHCGAVDPFGNILIRPQQ